MYPLKEIQNSRSKGSWAEDQACIYLNQIHYQIIHRNFRCKRGEIDIIALCPEQGLVFIEVKSSANLLAGHPSLWVGAQKIKRIQQSAEVFLLNSCLTFQFIRFDLITLFQTALPESPQIEHFINAFLPEGKNYRIM